MNILFIQAGGTIDKDYPQGETNHGYSFEISEPASKSIMSESFSLIDARFVSSCKKDSLDMNDVDRENIRLLIEASSEEKIIVTHGTDTMIQTAEYMQNIPNKTIIFTGAMLPEKFKNSDARFNIGMAVGAIQSLAHGTYIALYGRVADIDDFKKISQTVEATKSKNTSQHYDIENEYYDI